MATIFATRPGYAVVLPEDQDRTLPITIGGWGGANATRCLVTELSIERQGNFQFVHSLSDLIFVYSFGERVGNLRVSGLALANLCGSGSPGAPGSRASGLEYALAYYERYRLGSPQNAAPVDILIGSLGGVGHFRGYLTGFKAEIAKAEAAISQFALQFHSLPRGTGG